MPSINGVIKRVSRLRTQLADDDILTQLLMEIDGKLRREVVEKHEGASEGGELCAEEPYDRVYDLYLTACMDLLNHDRDAYAVSSALFNEAEAEFRRAYNREHAPVPPKRFKGV